MHEALGPGTILGYCTNVHAGATLEKVRANLERFALPIKAAVSPDRPMGVGLWFSAAAVRELRAGDHTRAFGEWLQGNGLLPYTLNGFPFRDFHKPVVKHAVYRPDWTDPARYRYTLDLARVLADLLPEDAVEGSISTLPIGWPSPPSSPSPPSCDGAEHDAVRCRDAAAMLTRLVHDLARLELDTGKHIHVNVEPEPGCLLDTAADVVQYFEEYLLGTPDEVSVRGYLGVCHDVCHSAVIFEPQADAVATYRAAGLRLGKAQLSSALRVPFDTMDATTQSDALHQLTTFAEERYLHQTVVRTDDGELCFHEDLPLALREAREAGGPRGEWRVHFHVPVYLDTLGPLHTTRSDIDAFLAAIRPDDAPHHYEVETYAWGVLPEALREADLAAGIARELSSIMKGGER